MSIDVVMRFLEWREAGETESCISLVADRALWHSPVGNAKVGREGFRDALEEAYAETRWFTTQTLGVQPRGDVIVAKVRNRGERDGEELDSVQLLVFRVEDDTIVDVRIYVDDPAAVSEFWSD
jgi:ketosteroid isomerase-like protein